MCWRRSERKSRARTAETKGLLLLLYGECVASFGCDTQ